MSETLNAPWIAEYLIDIAETYGCDISRVPVRAKPGKKVQLTQFLTFRQFSEDDCVWACVSDKHQHIPVRFSRHAIAEYDQINPGKRLTQERCAIATIKHFRPIFQRVPTGQVGKMTISETLALNVDYVQIVGGAGEPEFGSPQSLETHRDLSEWMEGLRAGDGSGNVLKLRKERKLAHERGEISATETPTAHEQRGYLSGQKFGAGPSDNKVHTKPDDWRESIAKKPLRYYKRPTAPKPTPTGPNEKNDNMPPPVNRILKPGKGALDPDRSPVITQSTNNGSPARSERQTTPSEWPASPDGHLQSHEAREVLPTTIPVTPLLTLEHPQAAPGQSARVPERAANRGLQASVRDDPESTSLRPPESHRRRQPLPSSSPALTSTFVTTSSSNRAATVPSDDFGPRARRVPPPSVTNTKEAYGEILVPSSDSGGPGTQLLSNENAPRWRARTAASPGRVIASLGIREHVNDADSLNHEPRPSQGPEKAQLDELSRMALNGSPVSPEGKQKYNSPPSAYGIHPHNGAEHNKGDAARPTYEPPPPSSPPIHSQTPSWHHSTALVEETVAMEGSPIHGIAPHSPASTTKRTRPLSPSPLRRKRPRLMSSETVVSSSHQVHGTTVRKNFDPVLLSVGIKMDLSDFDDNPPPHPWGEGMTRLKLGPPIHPLEITNARIAEIWKNLCISRGWCKQ